MSAVTQDTAVSTGRITRVFIYLVLLLFALFYLLPLFATAALVFGTLNGLVAARLLSIPVATPATAATPSTVEPGP